MNTFEVPATILEAVSTELNTIDQSPYLCRARAVSCKGFWSELKHKKLLIR